VTALQRRTAPAGTDATSPGRRVVLLIAYEFPPAAGGGVARLTAYAKYLRLCGWEVVVLAGSPGPGRPRDKALLADLEGIEVVRIPPRNFLWTLARLGAPVRTLLRRRRSPGTTPSASPTPAGPGSPLTTRLARRFAFPDEAVLWARQASRLALVLCRKYAVDVILASGPPFSALAAAVEVGAGTGIPVVLDMRDQWRDNVSLKWPTPALKRRSDELERQTLARAAAVVGATDGIVAEAIEMGAHRAETVHNGFDPERMVPHRPDPTAPLTIAFLGRFSRDVMDPTSFLEGFAAAVRREPAAARARVEVVGPDAPWVAEAAERFGVADRVAFHGFRPYDEALGIVSRADVGLMCVADAPGSRDLYPGKLFDYLGVGIPLLFVGPAAGGVARLVEEGGLGVAVRQGDVAAIADAIAGLARLKEAGKKLASPDPTVAARFDRRAQVVRLSQVLERAMSRRVAR
jgi:glycosyltransferase involved in cell wall biosynthesis